MSLKHSVAVVIPVFGDLSVWMPRAEQALASVRAQSVQPTTALISVADGIADAMNRPLEDGRVTTERVLYLGADDALDPHFIAAQDAVGADIIQPAIKRESDAEPVLFPRTDLLTSNYLICGAPVRTELILGVGGFDPSLPTLEDWDLWTRIYYTYFPVIARCPEAVYHITTRADSRNHSPEVAQTYRALVERNQAFLSAQLA